MIVPQGLDLFYDLYEEAPDAIFLVERNGAVVQVNRQAERLFGYASDELIGKAIEVLIPERFVKHHVHYRAKFHDAPMKRPMGAKSAELFGRHKDGHEIPIDIMLSPLKNQQQSLTMVVVRDVSERVRISEQLFASEAKFRAVFECAPDPILALDLSGKIIMANQQAAVVFGYSLDEMIGSPIELLVPTAIREQHVAVRDGFIKTPHARPMGAGLSLSARRKDGSEVPVDIMLSPIHTTEGDIILSIVRDITERRRAEDIMREQAKELKRSNEELEQFAYVASHDLQEPLRAVAGSCQFIERRLKGHLDADTQEFLGFAVEGAKRMQDLINDLLTFSRVGRGKTFGSVDLNQILDRVKVNLAHLIQETHARIDATDLPVVLGDSTQLVQLFQNLISNALKFRSEQAPSLLITAKLAADMVQIAVQDNGIGIPQAAQERIFVLFQRLHHRETYPGTGIGLAICKKIVESHQGKIWVESELGKGATFYFTLRKLPPLSGP